MSDAVLGYQYAFSIGNASSPVGYTEMAEIKSIKPNLMTVPNVDATHLKSPNATEEYIPGLIKPGTVDITGNFTGAADSQTQIKALAQARTVFPYKIVGPIVKGGGSLGTYTQTGAGFFSKYDTGPFEPSKAAEFTASIQISGSFDEVVA